MNRRNRHRGLSLVEVVVAVALLGIGIAACVACVGSATLASQRAEEFTAVQLLAREQLAQIELRGANPGADQGDFGPERPGFVWQTVTTEGDVPGLLQVRLVILWGNPEQPRRAEFVTQVRRPVTDRSPGTSYCDRCHTGKPGGGAPDRAALGALGVTGPRQAARPAVQRPQIRSGLFEVRLDRAPLPTDQGHGMDGAFGSWRPHPALRAPLSIRDGEGLGTKSGAWGERASHPSVLSGVSRLSHHTAARVFPG